MLTAVCYGRIGSSKSRYLYITIPMPRRVVMTELLFDNIGICKHTIPAESFTC